MYMSEGEPMRDLDKDDPAFDKAVTTMLGRGTHRTFNSTMEALKDKFDPAQPFDKEGNALLLNLLVFYFGQEAF